MLLGKTAGKKPLGRHKSRRACSTELREEWPKRSGRKFSPSSNLVASWRIIFKWNCKEWDGRV
jgi:hypothetical protein